MPKLKLIKSKHYENLFLNEASEIWQYRKWSSEKGREFFQSTKVRNTDPRAEGRAYKIGLELFNKWIGNLAEEDGTILFRKFATSYLDRKLTDPKIADATKIRFRGELEASLAPSGRKEQTRPRLLDLLGHLPLNRVNSDAWERVVAQIGREFPDFKFFNMRKALMEILRDAYAKRLIDRVPELELRDAEAAPPRELTREEIRRLFTATHFVPLVRGRGKTLVPRKDAQGRPVRRKQWIKLLMLIIWKQGARPGEILQYEWSMVHFDAAKGGKLTIPGRITKTRRSRQIVMNPQVARVLRFLRDKNPEGAFLFPSGQPGKPRKAYQKRWEDVCRRAGLDAQIYWFRDTFVTRKLKQGAATIFIAKYLDTSAEMLERKYAVTGEDAQRIVAK